MAIRVHCSQCGRTLSFPDSEAGLPALCNNCGTRLQVPQTSEQTPLPPQFADQQPIGWRWSAWVIGGVAAALLIGGIVIATRHALAGDAQRAWERQNAADIEQLKHDAEMLVVDAKPGQAYAKYLELFRLVGDRNILDGQLRSDVEEARVARDRMLAVSLRALEAPATQSSEALTPPPATTQRAEQALSMNSGQAPSMNSGQAERPNNPATQSVATLEPHPPAPTNIEVPPPAPFQITRSKTHITAVPGSITDEEIGNAIQKGVDYLIGEFGNAHRLGGEGDNGGNGGGGGRGGRGRRVGGFGGFQNTYNSGEDALAVLALIQCGDAIHDVRLNINGAFMSGCVSDLRTLDFGRFQTYGRGLRATALALLHRKEDADCLKDDVNYLVGSNCQGGYSYVKTTASDNWDNSNSQYGLLGVWAGAEVGVEVPQAYWDKVEKHWNSCQADDGEWGYTERGSGGRLSMSLAGVASLFVTHDYLDSARFDGSVGRDPFTPALAKGLKWLESGDHLINSENQRFGMSQGYTLYGIERVGLASGFKFFGAHDWYRELARDVVDEQERNGSWNDMVETCYSLLFLARGRHPVIMNKLRFEGSWANRPRDIANLARYASYTLERPINFQVVSMDHDWPDWTDAPILYLASHKAIKLSDEDVGKIRSFVQAGGLLFTNSDGNSSLFNAFAEDLARRCFPDYEMKVVPADSDLYTLVYKVKGWPLSLPPLKCVTNGSRILMVHSPTDMAMAWQQRADKSKEALFELGMNMFIYAGGKNDLRNRLNSPYIPPQQVHSGGTLRVARLQYPGNWDPEPMAWPRFVRWMAHETSLTIDVQNVEMSQLRLETAPVAHLTGTYQYTATEAQVSAVRQYVEAGGTLLIDDCGGENAFNLSMINDLLPRAFPQGRLLALSAEHGLRQGKLPGMDDLTARPGLRPYTITRLGPSAGVIQILKAGKGHVIFSSFDLVSGLLGTKTWGILGFSPDFCQAFCKNVILWTGYGAIRPKGE